LLRERIQLMSDSQKIKVLLVHDQIIILQGLQVLFENQPDIEVIEQLKTRDDVYQLTHKLKPDVIITDINTSETNSVALFKQILNEKPNIRIIALPTQLHLHVLEQAIKAGISGFVSLDCSFDEFADAVRAVYKNQRYTCPKIKDILANSYVNYMHTNRQSQSLSLTDREFEIIRLLSMGLTCKKIATNMKVSTKTVDAGRRQIMRKLNLNNMAELVKHAVRTGITSI
jgi:DNA-binding NarL/FixJ family response regulator